MKWRLALVALLVLAVLLVQAAPTHAQAPMPSDAAFAIAAYTGLGLN